LSAGVPTVLQGILSSTRQELARRKRELPLRALADRVEREAEVRPGGDGRFGRVLQQAPLGVVAEFKRRSPSAGRLRAGAEVQSIVRAYERGGASALSVLTEGPNFEGSLEDLRLARAASDLPILRKDFVVDSYQLYEAREAGADAVLLIVAALERRELAALHDHARQLGLDALVEVHALDELEVALDIGAELLGINNRDLRDFSVDLERTARLAGEVPAGVTLVSESGIAEAEQLRALAAEGVHAVLIGESLMRSAEPEAALRALLSAATSDARRANI
jgi:indole-3-glycerol phosphate synthase